MRKCLVILAVVGVSGCADAAKEQPKDSVEATYDKTTGRLRELAYDSNGNGRADTWTEMDGTKPLRSRLDRNEDGRIDRWEVYDDSGRLAKVGFSRTDTGKADAWAFSDADGKVERIEISSSTDEQRVARWEYYDASRSGADGLGALVRAEEDTTGDGKPDRWETYEGGAVRTVAFDEDGNGRPDRRLIYAVTGQVVIESDPGGSGRFARRVEAK